MLAHLNVVFLEALKLAQSASSASGLVALGRLLLAISGARVMSLGVRSARVVRRVCVPGLSARVTAGSGVVARKSRARRRRGGAALS